MKNLVRTIFQLVALTSLCTAQQLPNSDLEEWTLFPSSNQLFEDYEEPSGGVWSTGNGVAHIAPNSIPPTTKTTDAHSGQFAARLETQTVFGQIASGSLFTGRFSLDLSNPRNSAKLGVPFTGLPVRFRGWFKYQPAEGDSCSANCELTRWDPQSGRRVSIARARRVYLQAIPTWTQFDVEFVYLEQGAIPDSITMSFASSAGAEFLKGVQGSTMFVDDLSLSYDPVSVRGSEGIQETVPSLTRNGDMICLAGPGTQRYSVQGYDLMARPVPSLHHATANSFDVSSYQHAMLFFVIEDLFTHTVTTRTCYVD